MPRINPQFPGDQPLSVELDTGFVGVNDKVDPALLRAGNITYQDGQGAAGLAAAAQNNRFIAGLAQTRPGSLTAVHFNPVAWQEGGGDPVRLWGAGIYSDPDGREWLAVAGRDVLWLLADGTNPRQIPWPGGLQVTDSVELVQAFGNLVLLRGPELEPWQWNGDQTRPFYEVGNPPDDLTDPERPRYLSATPPAAFGIVTGDRLWLPLGRDGICWSDLLAYDAFDLSLSTARLNSGEDDSIVALLAWEGSILVFKDQSIFRLLNTSGDLSQLAAEPLNRGIGCLARRSVAQVGSEVFWLAQGGVYRISQAFESRLAANPIPVSDAIDSTMRRINWAYAADACGIVVDRYYYLAVPLDGATLNNAVLVYDTTTGQWQGIDRIARLEGIRRLVRTDLFGRRVPFILNVQPLDTDPMTTLPPSVVALDQGLLDRGLDGAEVDIVWNLTSRGYTLGELGLKRIRSVTAAWGQHGGQSRVSLLGEGLGEGRVISNWRSYSRTRYTRHGFPAYDPENAADTFSAPWREDYSWVAGDGTQLQSGLPLMARQHYLQGWPVRAEVRWIAVTFENRKGAFVLKSISADGLGEKNCLTRRN